MTATPMTAACPSCSGRRVQADFHSREERPCAMCRKADYEAWCDERRPATRRLAEMDEHGRCCGRKPRPYKRDGQLFCGRCHATFDMETKRQVPSWAWRADGDAFVAASPTRELARLGEYTTPTGRAEG